jgi:hypothetical protein
VLSIRSTRRRLHGGERRYERHDDRGLPGARDAQHTGLNIPDHDDQVVFGENPAPPQTWPFHVLLSVPHEAEEVERIGAREGWRAKTFGRGMQGHKPFFHVIEFWLENRLLIEVATPAWRGNTSTS